VQTIRYDDWTKLRAGSRLPEYCKIDVEGAEARVISGMVSSLSSGAIRAILCEVSQRPDCDARPEEIVHRMEAYGYGTWLIRATELVPYVPGNALDPIQDMNVLLVHREHAAIVDAVTQRLSQTSKEALQ